MKPEILKICSIIIIFACLFFGLIHYSLRQQLKKSKKQADILKRERSAYLMSLADEHGNHTLSVLTLDNISDLPNVGIQGIIYYIQESGGIYIWDNVVQHYVNAYEQHTAEIQTQQRLQRARERTKYWNRQYTAGEQMFETMSTRDNAWQYAITTYNRPTEYPQIRTEELDVDEMIKNTAPPVRKPKNRLKNIFGGNHV